MIHCRGETNINIRMTKWQRHNVYFAVPADVTPLHS